MSTDWYQDILDLTKAFGSHIEPFPRIPPDHIQRLRRKLIREEVNEMLDGMDNDNVEKTADGAADSIVVILGTCVAYGIDLRPIWKEIHKTNMAKVAGGVIRREDGKVLKPEGWQPPRVKELLDEQRGN